MSAPGARPRHSRKEIRDFADWLVKQGWVFESTDGSNHSIWSHPKSPQTYKLPETPKHFDVQRERRVVTRMVGQKVEGKRHPKMRPTPKAAPAVPKLETMKVPVRCRWCSTLHDAANVTVETRHKDCSTWRCPGCQVLIDDRPDRLGGSAIPVERKPPAAGGPAQLRAVPKRRSPYTDAQISATADSFRRERELRFLMQPEFRR